MSPLAIILKRGRAAGLTLRLGSRENSGRGIPWKKLDPRKAALVLALSMLPLVARADYVWIPTCIPFVDPPADALIVRLDGIEVRRISPVYPGRSHFWQGGRSTSLISLSLLRGTEEAAMRLVEQDAPFDPATCTGGSELAGPVSLGSYYGPREQLLRAIRSAQNGGGPIDTNQDGQITPLDQRILERTALGEFPDYTDFICAEDVCP